MLVLGPGGGGGECDSGNQQHVTESATVFLFFGRAKG